MINLKPLTIVIAICLVIAGAFWYLREPAGSAGGLANSPLIIPNSISISVPSLTQTYTDSAQHFSFNYPEDYAVREMPGDGDAPRTLVIESSSTGIQIIITPDDTDTNITAEVIREAISDMKVENPQSFPVGANSGLAFQSDNPAFNGASREVWFASKGFLYQISTYATNDQLLAAIFKTWKIK